MPTSATARDVAAGFAVRDLANGIERETVRKRRVLMLGITGVVVGLYARLGGAVTGSANGLPGPVGGPTPGSLLDGAGKPWLEQQPSPVSRRHHSKGVSA